jgi:hypothetical protein
MIPSVFDSSSVALKTGIKINEGVILSFIRIWIELIIFLFIIILYSGNIISNIIENSVNFNSLINLLCSEGLLFENPENITFLIAAVITITIINALVNWLFKNYAVRAFSRKRG